MEVSQNIEPKNCLFLIAMPELADPFFKQSVVLLLKHDTEGAMGLILNHPTHTDLKSFCEEHKLICHEDNFSKSIGFGGPVEPSRGWVLHSHNEIEEKKEIISGLYLSMNQESLKILLRQASFPFLLLLGYAGWSPGQLEGEMAQGSWLTAPLKSQHVLHTPVETMWKTVVKDLGVDPNQLVAGAGIH